MTTLKGGVANSAAHQINLAQKALGYGAGQMNYSQQSAANSQYMQANYGMQRDYTPRASRNTSYGIPRPDTSMYNNRSNRASLINGINNSLVGGSMSLTALKQAAKVVRQAHAFNSYVQNVSDKREIDAIERQGTRLFSAQQSAIGASGFSQGSKSFLMVANEAYDTVQTSINETRFDAQMASAAALFEAKIQERSFRLQAMQKNIEMWQQAMKMGASPKKSYTFSF